jgi:lipopolysaccharide/colanic/teichoic acid biosynthesis glycosyltransferase
VWYGESRSYARLGVDLTWVALSAFIALFIRDNFVLWALKVQGILLYALFCVVSAAIVFSAARLHRTLWRYVSLVDVLRLIAAVTIALLLALLGDFVLNRLEGVARSLPVIQWLLLITAMVGSRIAVRLMGERKGRQCGNLDKSPQPTQQVLVVGVNDLAELYLRSVTEFAPASFVIVGILSPESTLRGRFLRMYKILGEPADVQQVLAQLDIHGVTVDRIVVTQPFELLSRNAQEALRAVETSSAIKVDWLIESLGLRGGGVSGGLDALKAVSEMEETARAPAKKKDEGVSPSGYHHFKRVIDATAALSMVIVLAPVLALVALLVAIDVGFPIVFWQRRPGRYGRPFKLYKFRTMRGGHDAEGNRIADELRSSSIGVLLRRSWLDELPQLYNILVGEMSFVGPRPLLPIDQPKAQSSRLLVRPGLTGWAQINGGRDISSDDKTALDAWYIMNASLWLDIKTLLRTLRLVVSGGELNGLRPHVEHRGVEGTRTGTAVESEPTPLTGLNRLSLAARGAQQAP